MNESKDKLFNTMVMIALLFMAAIWLFTRAFLASNINITPGMVPAIWFGTIVLGALVLARTMDII